MRIAKIRQQDIANGPGLRVSVFVQGCTHHCDGCFNPETWDFTGGHEFTQSMMEKIIELGMDNHITGYSVLGGEPFQQPEIGLLLRNIKEHTGKPIWLWTGYTWETIPEEHKEHLKYVDVLVDGRYDKALKKPLRFRGSANQRIIDVQESLKQETPVLLPEYNKE